MKPLQPHEKLGLSELSYLLAFGQGNRSRKGDRSPYKKGTALRRAYNQGKRAK